MLKKEESQFQQLVENIYDRYRQGSGFLIGDVITLKKDFKNTDFFKNAAKGVQEILTYFATDCKNNVCIGSLKSQYPTGNTPAQDVITPAYWSDIYEELAPGKWGTSISVPVEIIELKYDQDDVEYARQDQHRRETEEGNEKTSVDDKNLTDETQSKSDGTNLKGIGN
jgi:hypothetical protein